MLDPRAIALGGVGYGPALLARLGVWGGGETPETAVPPAPIYEYSWGGRATPETERAVRLDAAGNTLADIAPIRERVSNLTAVGRTLASIEPTREIIITAEGQGVTLADVAMRLEQQRVIRSDEALLLALWASRRHH